MKKTENWLWPPCTTSIHIWIENKILLNQQWVSFQQITNSIQFEKREKDFFLVGWIFSSWVHFVCCKSNNGYGCSNCWGNNQQCSLSKDSSIQSLLSNSVYYFWYLKQTSESDWQVDDNACGVFRLQFLEC